MVVFEGERYSVDAMFVLLSSEIWVWIILCWAECDVPVPGIPVPGNCSLFYMVSEPVSEKFGTRTDFCGQNLGILKIYHGYPYCIGTGNKNLSFFWWYRNRYW